MLLIRLGGVTLPPFQSAWPKISLLFFNPSLSSQLNVQTVWTSFRFVHQGETLLNKDGWIQEVNGVIREIEAYVKQLTISDKVSSSPCFFWEVKTTEYQQIREGCTKNYPEKVWSFAKGGGVSEGSKMPNLYFGVLKRVKNGLKMAKKHIEILYCS